MTTARTRASTARADSPRIPRAVTAVLALYALALQALLGGMAPLSTPLPSAFPFDGRADVHCLQQAGDPSDPSPARPHRSDHHQPGCCTAATLAAGLAPPLPAATPVLWPSRLPTRLVWRMQGAPSARAPPNSLAGARAPPSSRAIA